MNEKALEVKKHIGIIHCTNKLTLLQRKLSNALLYHAYDNLLTQETHEIKIGDLAKLVGYDSHDYDTVKKALKCLMSIILEWNLLKSSVKKKSIEIDAGGGTQQEVSRVSNVVSCTDNVDPKLYSWHASTILASASIDGAMCRYSYSPELRSLLYMPEIYGKINLFIQSRFQSTYALALYENCVRYRNLEHTGWISLEVFRKLMGVANDKYGKFKDFKRRVLDKAIEEVNALSDLYVIVELQHCCQKTVAVRFRLSKNLEFKPQSVEGTKLQTENERTALKNGKSINDKPNVELGHILQNDFNFSSKKIKALLKKHDHSYIWEKISLIKNSSSYKERKIKNVTAYLLSALQDDFQPQKNDGALKRQLEDSKRKKEEKQKAEQVKAYRQYVNDKIMVGLGNIASEILDQINQGFHEEMLSNKLQFLVKKYLDSGKSDPVIQALYCDYIIKKHADVINNIVTIDSFEKFVLGYING